MIENGAKRVVTGTVVKVLLHRRDDRGMTLEPHASRCVREGEVHELVTTDHRETAPGARIDRVGFLGFAELHRAASLRPSSLRRIVLMHSCNTLHVRLQRRLNQRGISYACLLRNKLA